MEGHQCSMALILKKNYFQDVLSKDNKQWKPSFTKFDCCLLLFSIGTYLADISTDIILIIQYFKNQYVIWGFSTLLLVIVPSFLVQIFSLRWYILDGARSKMHWMIHIFNLGILERYIKLLKYGLKAQRTRNLIDFQHFYEAQSDVCMLRLFESFMESAPQLVLQLYIMFSTEKWNVWTGISAGISLISLSWGISAYSKAMRIVRLDKQKLSFCGMILQIMWRSGTVSCRIVSMVLFASVFGSWLLLIMSLHWFVMTVWVIFQDTDFCTTWWEERLYNCIVGEIYCFCFFNLKEGHSRYRSTIFYSVTFTENVVFLLSYYLLKNNGIQDDLIVGIVLLAFAVGVLSMLLYYRFFHPSGPITFNNAESEKNEMISVKEISIGIENFTEENFDDCFLEKSTSQTKNDLSAPIFCNNSSVNDDKILSCLHKFQNKDFTSISNMHSCYQENHQSHSQNCSILTLQQDSIADDSLIMKIQLRKQLANHHKLVNYNFRTQASFQNLYDSQIHCSCLVLMENDLSLNELKSKSSQIKKDLCNSLPNLSSEYQSEESYLSSKSDPFLNRTWSLCNLYKSELINYSTTELEASILTNNDLSSKKCINKLECKCSFILPTGVTCRCARKQKKHCINELSEMSKTYEDRNNLMNNVNELISLNNNNNNNNFKTEASNIIHDMVSSDGYINFQKNDIKKKKFIAEQEIKDKINFKIMDNKSSVQDFHFSEIFQKTESDSSIPTLSKVCIVWNDATL